MTTEIEIDADGLRIAALAAGPDDGPLALCLHGFPDTAHTYRHLLPRLADAGYRAVAPFSRGYAPTAIPADGHYQTGALARDANLVHEALGADERAVIIGHDWGAQATYGAAGSAPERWRRVVAMAVPVGPALAGHFFNYDQIKKSFYMYFFQNPLADFLVAANDHDFIAQLWDDWSPGYAATDDLAFVRASLADPANLNAALGYYRALFDPARQTPDLAAEQQAVGAVPPQPTLYLHGADDGCIGVAAAEAAPGSPRREIRRDRPRRHRPLPPPRTSRRRQPANHRVPQQVTVHLSASGCDDGAPFSSDRWRGDGAKMARESSASFRRRAIVGRRPSRTASGVTCEFLTLGDP